MQLLSPAQLATITGGDDSCPITNKTDLPVSIYQPGTQSWVGVGPGETGSLRSDRSVFYPYNLNGAGNVDGCKPGRSFQIVPNAPYYPGLPRTERTSG